MKYVDSSAFVKYYSTEDTEKGAGKVVKIIDDASKGKFVLITSALLLGEVVSAFDKWQRIGGIDAAQLKRLVEEFFFDINELHEQKKLIVEPIDPLFTLFTIELILKHHISVNDAIHLYTALAHFDEIDEFICSDSNLIKAAESEGFRILNPEE